MHEQGGRSQGDADEFDTSTTYSSWHTATIAWTPTACTFVLDGHLVGTARLHVPDTPMHWVIQTETSLDEANPSPSAAGNVQIDWVTAYVPTRT